MLQNMSIPEYVRYFDINFEEVMNRKIRTLNLEFGTPIQEIAESIINQAVDYGIVVTEPGDVQTISQVEMLQFKS